MQRLLITLGAAERSYLVRRAKETGVPMSAVVRQAIRRQQEAEEASLDEALRETSGLWKKGDGLRYQMKVRREWE